MTATQPASASSSSFARFFGLGALARTHRAPSRGDDVEDEWYTPYNGPYAISSTSPNTARGSWGPLLSLNSANAPTDTQGDDGGGRGRGRDRMDGARVVSNGSRLTMSSAGHVDPFRRSILGAQPRRSGTTRTTQSFVGANGGGVGESPVPVQRFQSNPTPVTQNRLSLASFLTFGHPSRRMSSAPSSAPLPPRRPSSPSTSPTAATTSLSQPQGRRRRPPAVSIETEPALAAASTVDDAYVDSYYSTLLSNPEAKRARAQTVTEASGRPSFSPTPYGAQSPSHSPHPYAYAFPSTQSSPRRAPPVIVQSPTADKGKAADRAYHYPPPPRLSTLNAAGSVPDHLKPTRHSSMFKAISTPNLRSRAFGGASPSTEKPPPRGKHRWLSPETWCDAILFPRPRFLVRIEGEDEEMGLLSRRSQNTRMMSPAGSPVLSRPPGDDALRGPRPTPGNTDGVHPRRGAGPQPRGLPKSKSAVNLSMPEAGPSRGPPQATPMLLVPNAGPRRDRPRSFAQDDLALPSPVPSLANVLRANENLDRERAEWKNKAAQSLLNKRTRSISRARSKSFGNAQRARVDSHAQEVGNFDFLAARTLLGSQAVAPTVHQSITTASSMGTKSGVGTYSSISHTRTRSHAHSNSVGHSSEGPIRGHARSGSLGKSVLRTATSFCISGEGMSPLDEKSAFDGSLKRQDTKVVRLEEEMRREHIKQEEGMKSPMSSSMPLSPPVTLSIMEQLNHPYGPSPTPSGQTMSGEGVQLGIAISSPVPSEERQEDTEPIFMPDHPYAQRGYSTPFKPQHHSQHSASTNKGSDYAGPHPSTPAIPVRLSMDEMSARHRLPPHATLPHPYALGAVYSQREEQPRLPDVPSSPYLPLPEFTSDYSSEPHLRLPSQVQDEPPLFTRNRDSGPVHAYAAGNRFSGKPIDFADAMSSYLRRRRGSIDSGLGDSTEGHAAEPPVPPVPATPPSGRDFVAMSRQVSAHTVASSPPETLNPPFFRPSMDLAESSTGGMRSGSSSPQLSPQPFGGIEDLDLDRYRNLFYQPSGSDRTPPGPSQRSPPSPPGYEVAGAGGGSLSFDVASRSSHAGSSLTNLTRQLSMELDALQQEETVSIAQSMTDSPRWGRRLGGLRGTRPPDLVLDEDPNMVLSMSMSSASAEGDTPGSGTLPLRMHRMGSQQAYEPPRISIPEDVESSRASSIFEHSPMEDPHADDILRLGTIEAVATPAAEAQFERHISFIAQQTENERERSRRASPEDKLSPINTTRESRSRGVSASSLLPPRSAQTDMTRSSYLTSDTGTSHSRMSGLSDFPVPPDQIAGLQDHVHVLQSYFGDTPASQRGDPLAAVEREVEEEAEAEAEREGRAQGQGQRRPALPEREADVRVTVASVYSQI